MISRITQSVAISYSNSAFEGSRDTDNPLIPDSNSLGGPTRNFATIDADRLRRTGFPEVILGSGKSIPQISQLAAEIYAEAGFVLVTRSNRASFVAVQDAIPNAKFVESCGAIWADQRRPSVLYDGIAVVCAGTADLPVADEAALVAELMQCRVVRVNDVGIAGIHRLLNRRADIEDATAIVVVAGMDGALPAAVAGLVAAPVIAVPTSTGYGTGLGGYAAMLTMLNSCAAGVSVVNIDAGFSAGYQAGTIAKLAGRVVRI